MQVTPADNAALDQLISTLVPQTLGRASARKWQQVGANMILAQHLNHVPDRRQFIGDEIFEALGARDHDCLPKGPKRGGTSRQRIYDKQ